MPLEATMMIIDNSEYMRNGDYLPTRFDAQKDAVRVIFETKTDSNPENSIGIMTMAGKAPEVLVTHSRELGQIYQAVESVRPKIGGVPDLPTAINVAQLALKHRQNKNLRQRIVVLLGSPLDGVPGTDEQNLSKLAKRLKKNNIALDIICFGDGIEEGPSGNPVLKEFVEGINNSDNSHYLSAYPDLRPLSDTVLSTVLASDRGARDQDMAEITNAGGSGGDGNTFEEFGGVDPTLDPELAMALRMSMEEERARRRAQEQVAAGAVPSEAPQLSSIPEAGPSTSVPQTVVDVAPGAVTSESSAFDDDEEAALQEALRLSQQADDVEMSDATKPGTHASTTHGQDEEMDEDEEEAIARAIEMSMQPGQEQKK